MTAGLRLVGRRVWSISHRTTTKRKASFLQWQPPARSFSYSSSIFVDRGNGGNGSPGANKENDASFSSKPSFTVADLDDEARTRFERASPEEQQELREALKTLADLEDRGLDLDSTTQEMEAEVGRESERLERELPIRLGETRLPKNHSGFWADEEEEEFARVEDEDDNYQYDDITSMAHAQLDLHRDMREYQRRVAWDMPHLRSTSFFSLPFSLTSPLSAFASCLLSARSARQEVRD